ncbi:hypothetical protein V5E97_09840 [Singulisphaera sp. Ch08]|uniref:Uncharacterized protein n=1 Tax=Singulisphaera sp. Ch08 TaxID=3120278 RepID=A0AAU7CNY7_9BACT
MTTATAKTAAQVPAAAKHTSKVASSSFTFGGETRPLTADEFSHARFVVRRWDSARGFVAKQFGHADETDEFQAARKRLESFEGDDLAYLRAAKGDRDLLQADQLQSYARYSAHMYDPESIERATWMMLRSAEVDVIRLVHALAESAASTMPGLSFDAPVLILDGHQFSIAFLDEDYDVSDARLIVKPLPGANQGDREPSLN